MKLSRRNFLRRGVGGAAGLYLGWSHLSALAVQAANFEPRKPGSRILVIVQLAGGNDGINTVIPYSSGDYYKARPVIAIKQDKVLALNNDIGLHPNMTAMQDLYKSGKLAVVLGAGYPNPNRSHFRSIEIWQTAEPERIVDTGWLGRYLDMEGSVKTSSGKVFPAINVDPILPKTLSAQHTIIPSVSNLNQFHFNTDSHYQKDRQAQLDSFNEIYKDFSLNRPQAKLLRDVGMDALQASDYLLQATKNYKSSAQYPDNGFGRSMKFIAQMITAGVNARVYNVSHGGFDTHANQLNAQGTLLKQLSDGIAAFHKDLQEHHVDQDVVVMTFSEFGRRVAQNNGNGTDHGTAEPLFIAGTPIKGGIYGAYPSMSNLDNGDLKYTVDFRSVYSTVLDRWLAADSKEVLGKRYEDLAFI